MRFLPLLLLLLTSSAAASAPEPSFRAVWIQPVTLLATLGSGLVLPVGLSSELTRDIDLTVELTPYFGGRGTCVPSTCREQLFGLVAAGGATFGRPVASTPLGDVGLYFTPKLLVAVADELGPQNPPESGISIPGISSELGAGFDLSLELRPLGSPYLYISLIFGAQLTALFNVGSRFDGADVAPSWPILMMPSPTTITRQPGPRSRASANPNFIRIGLVL